jgi:hypothetical protein
MYASPTLIGSRPQSEVHAAKPVPGICDRARQEAEFRLVGRSTPPPPKAQPQQDMGEDAPSLRTAPTRTAAGP